MPKSSVQSESKANGAGIASELALGDIPAKRAVKTEDARNALRWAHTERVAPYFDRACEVYLRDKGIKASELAERMTVDETVFSQMRAGKRIIDGWQEDVLREHRPSKLILAAADRDRLALSMSTIKDRIAEIVIEDAERGGILGRTILDEVARREQVERGDVDAAIEQGDEHERAPGDLDASASQ